MVNWKLGELLGPCGCIHFMAHMEQFAREIHDTRIKYHGLFVVVSLVEARLIFNRHHTIRGEKPCSVIKVPRSGEVSGSGA